MNDAAPDLLMKLLLDQSERWGRGQPFYVEAYLQRHPDLADDEERLLDLISNEIYLRCARGDAPSPAEYRGRFPQLAEQISMQFQLHQAAGAPSSVLPSSPAPLFDARPTVPGYEVHEEIGRGAMGIVYKARQLSLKRIVALKMLQIRGKDEATVRSRFRSEALAVARLQHANIVQIFDVGEHQGCSYFSFELVEGGNLARRTQGKQLPEHEAARHAATLARAMHYAHQRGVVHRDLKPANILLTREGTLKITDFGLAKLMRATRRLTRIGDVLGTPSYMAPEQARGDGEVGATVDVYSLGAILYEMLTGKPPFLGESAIATLLLVGTTDPDPPTAIRPDLTPDLNAICLKCLHKNPAERYATAEALADDLDRFLLGTSVQARPLGLLSNFGNWCLRIRSRMAWATAALLVVGLVTAGVAHYVGRVERERDQAIHDKEQALEQANEVRPEPDVGEAQREAARRVARKLEADREAIRKIEAERDSAQQALRAAETERDAARQAGVDSAQQLLEARRTLDRVRQERYARQLLESATLVHTEPLRAKRMLEDDSSCPPDLRDLTWTLLTRACERPHTTLQGHLGTILSIALSHDGRTLAGAGTDGATEIWDLETRREPLLFGGHKGHIHVVAFAQKGKTLATAGADHAVRLWDSAGKLLHKLNHKSAVFAVVFLPNGKLASAGADGDIRLWNVATGKEETVFSTYNKGAVRVLTSSPDGSYLASTADDGLVQFWNKQKWPVRSGYLLSDAAPIAAMTYSPDGKRIATASADGTVRIWDATTGVVKHILTGHNGAVCSVAFSPDGKLLASGTKEMVAQGEPIGTVKIWDSINGKLLLSIPCKNPVLGLNFLHDNKRLAIASGSDVEIHVATSE